MTPDVALVGAGLSGLACARALVARGLSVTVLDTADAAGGRVRTDLVDGFRIDRGFQVLLTAYPEARRVLDMAALDLRPFASGALVHHGGRFHRIADPFRSPLKAVETLRSPVGSLADKLRVLKLRQTVRAGHADDLWARPEMTTAEALRARYGFSDDMVERFFRPFLGGIQLDRSLGASSRAFEFTFRMFSEGSAAVPALGMQAIPDQLAAALPEGVLRLNARVAAVEPGVVRLDSGETVEARAVVVATDGHTAAALLPGLEAPPWHGTLQLAWAADAAPTAEPILMLDGEGAGPVNNVQVMSAVSPDYAPPGQALVTASVIGVPEAPDADVDAAARQQLRRWFGRAVDGWRLLRADRVPHALPALASLEPPERPLRVADGLYVAGDHRRTGSIDAALVVGRHAAEAVAADLAG